MILLQATRDYLILKIFQFSVYKNLLKFLAQRYLTINFNPTLASIPWQQAKCTFKYFFWTRIFSQVIKTRWIPWLTKGERKMPEHISRFIDVWKLFRNELWHDKNMFEKLFYLVRTLASLMLASRLKNSKLDVKNNEILNI